MLSANFLLPLLAVLPLSHAANYISEGGFEGGTWGKWTLEPGSEGTISVVSPGYQSKHAGAHNINARNGSLLIYYPVVDNLTIGQLYTWSFDYKLNNPYCTTLVQNYEGIPLSLGYGINPVENGTWASHNVTFFSRKGQEGFSLVTFCDVPASEPVPSGPTAEFDNLVFEVLAGSKIYHNNSTPTGPNLINQPNFGSGNLKAYEVLSQGNTSVKIVSPGYNGTAHAASITQTATTLSPTANEFIQNITASTKDTVYKLSVAFKTVTTFSFYCAGQTYIQQGGFPANTEYIPYVLATQFPVSDSSAPVQGKWVVYENLVAGLSDGFQIGVELDCDYDQGDFEIGDISLVPLS